MFFSDLESDDGTEVEVGRAFSDVNWYWCWSWSWGLSEFPNCRWCWSWSWCWCWSCCWSWPKVFSDENWCWCWSWPSYCSCCWKGAVWKNLKYQLKFVLTLLGQRSNNYHYLRVLMFQSKLVKCKIKLHYKGCRNI